MNRILVCFMVAFVFTLSSSAQDPAPPQSIPAKGMELFRGLLNYHGVKPLTEAEFRLTDRSEVIFILMGRPSKLGFEPGLCNAVLSRNGSVLIATEEPLDLSFPGYLPQRFSPLQITGERVRSSIARRCFNGESSCPFVVPKPENLADQFLREEQKQPLDPARNLLIGLTRVATNVPSAIRSGPLTSEIEIGGFPIGCRTEFVDGPPLQPESKLIVASTGPEMRPYRLLVVADTGFLATR